MKKTLTEIELQELKPWDDVQCSRELNAGLLRGYVFITTAGHGYLAVLRQDLHYTKALKICKYGFKGKLACYLEEDCEIGEFEKAIAPLETEADEVKQTGRY